MILNLSQYTSRIIQTISCTEQLPDRLTWLWAGLDWSCHRRLLSVSEDGLRWSVLLGSWSVSAREHRDTLCINQAPYNAWCLQKPVACTFNSLSTNMMTWCFFLWSWSLDSIAKAVGITWHGEHSKLDDQDRTAFVWEQDSDGAWRPLQSLAPQWVRCLVWWELGNPRLSLDISG